MFALVVPILTTLLPIGFSFAETRIGGTTNFSEVSVCYRCNGECKDPMELEVCRDNYNDFRRQTACVSALYTTGHVKKQCYYRSLARKFCTNQCEEVLCYICYENFCNELNGKSPLKTISGQVLIFIATLLVTHTVINNH